MLWLTALINGSETTTMTLLQTFINDAHNRPSLAIFQSSTAQTTVPVLRQYLATSPSKAKPRHRILISLLYLPSDLVDDKNGAEVQVYDWLYNVPGYSGECFNPGLQLLSTLDQGVYRLAVVNMRGKR